MVGWHHWLDGHESEWTPGVGDGQEVLACCDSWGHKESDTTERLNWTEHLKLTTADLKPLFDCLKGDPNPSSKRELTSEAESALVKVDEALSDQLIRVNITRGWDLIILATEHTPTGCLWQEGPLEWLHLPVTPPKNSFVLSQLADTINYKR